VIELYTWATPNGAKPAIMLEEIGLEYRVHLVDITNNEQFAPEFLSLSPNNKIPALVDHDPSGGKRVVFESGAALIYLAEKTGKLLPAAGTPRDEALGWLFWASTGVGPTFGQFGHFAAAKSGEPDAALARFTQEASRLIGVLERRLGAAPYLARDYSIADIAAFTWVHFILASLRKVAGSALEETPCIDQWLRRIAERPAVQRGLRAPKVRLRSHH